MVRPRTWIMGVEAWTREGIEEVVLIGPLDTKISCSNGLPKEGSKLLSRIRTHRPRGCSRVLDPGRTTFSAICPFQRCPISARTVMTSCAIARPFHPKTVCHSKMVSSQNGFIPKRFHPKTVSSKIFRPRDPSPRPPLLPDPLLPAGPPLHWTPQNFGLPHFRFFLCRGWTTQIVRLDSSVSSCEPWRPAGPGPPSGPRPSGPTLRASLFLGLAPTHPRQHFGRIRFGMNVFLDEKVSG